MAQFDVYRNPNTATNWSIPYLLDVQVELLDHLATRLVVPLVSASTFGKPIEYLNPRFVCEGHDVVMSTAEMAGIPIAGLGEKIDNLTEQRQSIMAALDFLLFGF